MSRGEEEGRRGKRTRHGCQYMHADQFCYNNMRAKHGGKAAATDQVMGGGRERCREGWGKVSVW